MLLISGETDRTSVDIFENLVKQGWVWPNKADRFQISDLYYKKKKVFIDLHVLC